MGTEQQGVNGPAGVRVDTPTNWSSPEELVNRSTSASPALAANGTTLAMAWRGLSQDNIFVSTSTDGSNWSAQKMLGDRATSDNPALCGAGGTFVMAWRGADKNSLFVSTSSDGLTWSPQRQVPGRASQSAPGLAGVPGLFVMAWRGLSQDNIFVATSEDGLNWGQQQMLHDRGTRDSPALAGTARGPNGERTFVMLWRGQSQNNLFVSTSTDGWTWSPQQLIPGRASGSHPAITYSKPLGAFYAVWRGVFRQTDMYVSSSGDGKTWTPQEQVNGSAAGGPAVASTDSILSRIWWGDRDNHIYASTLVP